MFLTFEFTSRIFLHGNARAVSHLAHWRKLNYKTKTLNYIGERTGTIVKPYIRNIYIYIYIYKFNGYTNRNEK